MIVADDGRQRIRLGTVQKALGAMYANDLRLRIFREGLHDAICRSLFDGRGRTSITVADGWSASGYKQKALLRTKWAICCLEEPQCSYRPTAFRIRWKSEL
jgi:hypothetical protein